MGRLRPRVVTALAAVVLTASGCSGDSSDDGPHWSTPDTPSTTTTAYPEATAADVPVPAETESAVVEPPKPRGSVPRSALGVWVGGLGTKEDFTLIVVSKEEYQLEHRATPALPAFVEQGWIVGDSDELLLRPVHARGITARERTVGWFRQPNSAGVDLLVINDPVFGELDFVRGNP
jgi:hypothetical protein